MALVKVALFTGLLFLAFILTFGTDVGFGQGARNISVSGTFTPSGLMGDIDAIRPTSWTANPHSGPTCIQIIYDPRFNNSARSRWAGIYWQYPANNWGDMQQGQNLTGAKNLTFWARGDTGGEIAEFKVGGITGQYPDSIEIPLTTGVIVLSENWTTYTIDLIGQDLSHVIGGFCWVTNEDQNPVGSTIYLDDIYYMW
jgi:hypothetical protein